MQHRYQSIIASAVADANAPKVVIQFIKKSKKSSAERNYLVSSVTVWPINISSRRILIFFFFF